MGAGTILLVVVVVFVLWKKRMGGKRRSRAGGAGSGDGGFEYDPERDSAGGMQHTPQEKAKLDFESEHDVAFDFGAFFRDRKGRSPSEATGGSGSAAGSRVSVGGGSVVEGKRAELEDRLPAFEAPRGGAGLPQQQQQQQPVVAELDGGAVPEYRGVVGVGR